MPYPLAFLENQAVVARSMAALTAQPFGDGLLSHTALYCILGLDSILDPWHPSGASSSLRLAMTGRESRRITATVSGTRRG